MTENTTEIDRIEASELFAPASELPETNYRARTLAQILVEDSDTAERLKAICVAGGTCAAHGHKVGGDGSDPVISDGLVYCRECAEYYDLEISAEVSR